MNASTLSVVASYPLADCTIVAIPLGLSRYRLRHFEDAIADANEVNSAVYYAHDNKVVIRLPRPCAWQGSAMTEEEHVSCCAQGVNPDAGKVDFLTMTEKVTCLDQAMEAFMHASLSAF